MDDLETEIRKFCRHRAHRFGVRPAQVGLHIKQFIEEIRGGKELRSDKLTSAQVIPEDLRIAVEDRISNFAVELMEILIQQFRQSMETEWFRIHTVLAHNYKIENGLTAEIAQKINKEK